MITKQELIPLIDLTDLITREDSTAIEKLCQKAQTPLGSVAAVCVYPQWVSLAKQRLEKTSIAIATVVNFPRPCLSQVECQKAIVEVIDMGADEVDVVMPYTEMIQGQLTLVRDFLFAIREASQSHVLKVIIESGALTSLALIKQAARLVIASQADFIKTSTGKIQIGAKLEAVKVIANALLEDGSLCGLKISGGIKTFDQACCYYDQIHSTLGYTRCHPSFLRFGASQLLDNCLN